MWRYSRMGQVKMWETVDWRRKTLELHLLKSPKTVPKTEIWIRKSHIWSLSTNFRFFGGKSQSQQKLAKTITYFITQFRSKNLTYFTKLNSLNVIKNILSQRSQKHVSDWCQKKHLHCTISRRPGTAFSGAFGKQMSVYSSKSPFGNFRSRDVT